MIMMVVLIVLFDYVWIVVYILYVGMMCVFDLVDVWDVE